MKTSPTQLVDFLESLDSFENKNLQELMEKGYIKVFNLKNVPISYAQLKLKSAEHTHFIVRRFREFNNTTKLEIIIIRSDIADILSEDILQSSIRAIEQGFVYYNNTKSMNPAFIHATRKTLWIHSISKLKNHLNTESYLDLLDRNYDVDAYYTYNRDTSDTESIDYFKWLAADALAELALPHLLGIISKENTYKENKESVTGYMQEYYADHILYSEIRAQVKKFVGY